MATASQPQAYSAATPTASGLSAEVPTTANPSVSATATAADTIPARHFYISLSNTVLHNDTRESVHPLDQDGNDLFAYSASPGGTPYQPLTMRLYGFSIDMKKYKLAGYGSNDAGCVRDVKGGNLWVRPYIIYFQVSALSDGETPNGIPWGTSLEDW